MSIIEDITQAQSELRSGDFVAAHTLATGVLEEVPEHQDALYIKAVSERYLTRFQAAFDTLACLLDVSPEFGRAFQEQGHLHVAQGNLRAAERAYWLAVTHNPALVASWRALQTMASDLSTRKSAQAQAQRLDALPPTLFSVESLLHEGKTLKAENMCRAFLQANPTNVEAMRLLAKIATQCGVPQDTEFLLESAVVFEPDNVQLRLDYITALRKQQKYEAALAQAKYLYDLDPVNRQFQSYYAVELLQTGQDTKALAVFDTILQQTPNDAATLTSRGHALKTMGRQAEAIESYRAAYRAAPDDGMIFYSLANLKTYRFADSEIQHMEARVDAAYLAHKKRVSFYFALAKAYEDRAQYTKAFENYEKGNALKRTVSGYQADATTKELVRQKECCTKELFARHEGKGCSAPDPIFIVGLPRAGSTLLEQILSSHSQVDGTLELPNVLSLAQRLRERDRRAGQEPYPASLWGLSAAQLQEFGQEYIDTTKIHRQGAPFFTDKMPNNFRHIGLIHLVLPNAKIIDARRAPLDCCFSGFKQLFAEGQEFTYGLHEIGQYYRDYVDVMAHWDRLLPGKICRVYYEDVVADMQTQVHRILDYCNLPFEESCIRFHQTERSVRTASSEQVRQPIYKSGIEYWRHFDTFLSPLKEALGPVLTEYRK